MPILFYFHFKLLSIAFDNPLLAKISFFFCNDRISYRNAFYFVINFTKNNIIGCSRRKITQDKSIVPTGIFYRRWKIYEGKISSRIRMINYQFRLDYMHFDGNAYIWSRLNPEKVYTNLSYNDKNYDDEQQRYFTKIR